VNSDEGLPRPASQAIRELSDQCASLSEGIETFETEIVHHARSNEVARRLATIPGVGPVTASLIAATVSDIGVFPSARHFAAWLGLVPRQNSTGGKSHLGRITKAGHSEIRRMLVLGATSMIFRAEKWNSSLGAWTRSAMLRRPVRLVTVALANKIARIAWALITRNDVYRPTGQVAAAAQNVR
jgi:transposase